MPPAVRRSPTPMALTTLVLPAALILLASGCDKPAGEAATTATAPSSASAAPAVFDVEGFCEKAMALPATRTCAGDDEIREGNKVGYCTTVLRKAQQDGRVRFDKDAAQACLKAVEQTPTLPDRRTLGDLGRLLPACRGVVAGKQAKGAECDRTMECAAGLVCHEKSCQPQVAKGQACSALKDDGPSNTRSTCTPPLGCIEGKCADEKPPALAAEGKPCAGYDSCAHGLFCSDEKPKVCRAKKKAGSDCSHSRQCLGRCSRQDGRKCVAYCGSG